MCSFPLRRTVEDANLLMHYWCQEPMFEKDPLVAPVIWRDSEYTAVQERAKSESLSHGNIAESSHESPSLTAVEDVKISSDSCVTIGYFESDDFFEASEPCKRAVRESVEALKRLPNVQLVAYKPPKTKEACTLYYSLMSAEGKLR